MLYIRHGQTDYNVNDLWMGSIDAPLNSQGLMQARNAAIDLSRTVIKKIYSSPLVRAYETALFIADKQSILPEIIVMPGLRERCFGELEGRSKSVEARNNLTSYSGVENEYCFRARILSAMNSIEKNETVLIVSHSAVFRCLSKELSYSVTPPVEKILNCQIVRLCKEVCGVKG